MECGAGAGISETKLEAKVQKGGWTEEAALRRRGPMSMVEKLTYFVIALETAFGKAFVWLTPT